MTAEFIVAVHSIVYLNHKKTAVSSEDIAENVCTNPARVRKVMLKLKKAGLVEVKTGIQGGYTFSLNPSEVTLYDIFKATSGHFIDVKWRSGNENSDCAVSKSMKPIMDEIFDELDEAGKKTLEKITVSEIDGKISI